MILILSGLPRSGSSLICSILRQNPDIYAGGRSGLLPLLWDINSSFDSDAAPFLLANKKNDLRQKVLNNLILEYHNDGHKFSVDKNAFWCHPNNRNLRISYVKNQGKIIVLIREIEDIMKSWVNVYKDFAPQEHVENWIMSNERMIDLPIQSIIEALQNGNQDELEFISYEELVYNTKNTFENIYKAWKLNSFDHYFTNIDETPIEDDSAYGVTLHNVRSEIGIIKNNITLSNKALEYCEERKDLLNQYGILLRSDFNGTRCFN